MRLGLESLIVRINNAIVRRRRIRVSVKQLLLLVPHCLQNSACEHNLINDLDSCERCGKCNVADLLKLRDELHIPCRMAGGGRQAAAWVKDPGVKAIIACACEKELVDGIRTAFPKPVWAIPNERPHGPCKDTRIDISRVRTAVMAMLNTKKEEV